MTRTALVVGGTGPTGPSVVEGLRRRDFEVTLFHRGSHELEEVADLEHLHGDPHFAETIDVALGDRQFDVVIATYGRTRLLAEHLAGRCGQFIGVGGSAVYPGWVEPGKHQPYGMRVLAGEEEPLEVVGDAPTKGEQFANKMIETERAVFALHASGGFAATWFRYPRIYGPRNLMPYEWSVLRRIRDGRTSIILHDGGLQIRTRCSAWNAAHSLLLAVDLPDTAAGEIYNVGDSFQASERQWVDLIAGLVEAEIEVVTLPMELSSPSWFLTPFAATASPHCVMDTTKIRIQLGYQDVVSAEEALARTLAWLDANPVAAADYPVFQDLFDYDYEDRLTAAYAEAIDRARSHVGEVAKRRPTHAYAHPDKAATTADQRGR